MPSHARGVFVAGTDTGVGKTLIATAMVRALVREGMRIAVMKPVAAGAEMTPEGLRNADALALALAANVARPYAQVNPFCLPLAASPHIAALNAGIRIDIAAIVRATEHDGQVLVVEGAGGWLAPISESETMADVARALELPVILVVGLRLGCLNHALLTAASIASSNLPLAGWIANHMQPDFAHAAENIAFLEQRLDAPLLESVAFGGSAFVSATAAKKLAAVVR
jgi:dethiobiotin synthetase